MEHAISIFNQAVDILNYLATHVPWDAVAASGILSGLLLGPQKAIKKYFEHNEAVMILVVGIAGLLVAGGNYLLHVPTHDPSIIALQGAALAFMTQPFYFIVVKPLSKKVSAWFAGQAAKAVELNDVKSAIEPAGGLPAPVTPQRQIEVQDFNR